MAASHVTGNRAVGLVAAVVRWNDTLLLRNYGRADLEWDVPMPVVAMFEIGSVAKQFTAVAVLQMRDQEKLTLDDHVTRWLPDFHTRGNEVTLRPLLDHTCGVHDFTETAEFRTPVSNRVVPQDSAHALSTRCSLDFPSDERQLYSNSGLHRA